MQLKTQERLAGVLTQVRRVVDSQGPDSPTDGELLARFVAARDQAAFELLVWRHGTMVLHTCRRLLARPEDAEDAFQATFLAFVRQAAGIGKRGTVAGWLHRVACRAALRLRAQAARRTDCERQSMNLGNGHPSNSANADGEAVDPLVWAEARQALDGEVNRLPAKLRVPFVLCYLEGLTNDEAARQLNLPRGTVLSRLSRARERLRGRLGRRGWALTSGAFIVALGQEAATSAAAAPLVVSTIKTAMLVAAGQATAAVAAAPVALLTEGVVQAMFLDKIKVAMAVVLSVGLVSGAGGIVYQSQVAGQAVDPLERKTPVSQVDPQHDIAQSKEKKPLANPPTDPKPDPGPKPSPGVKHVAPAEVETAKAKMAQLERQYQQAQVQLNTSQAALEQAKADLDLARREYERILQLAGTPVVDPKKSAVSFTPPGDLKGPPVPVTPQADLIHLATAYVDAIRDQETAKVRLRLVERSAASVSNVELETQRIAATAADRKVNLLREIIDVSLKAAQDELTAVRVQYEAGRINVGPVSAAESKVKLLKLILGTK